jgi:hypothetical protein
LAHVLIPSSGPNDWRAFLGKPDLHWVTGYSARTLAHSWEDANGIPPEVANLLAPITGALEPLVIIPEHKTPLPGGRRESQSDVFLLARHGRGTIACTIEGKVDEPFGPTVGKQMSSASIGQTERMAYLCQRLRLETCPEHIHYQLLHRTVSALIEANRFCTTEAAMVVHSFSPTKKWFDAFLAFVDLLGGGEARVGQPVVISGLEKPLILGWAIGDARFRQA